MSNVHLDDNDPRLTPEEKVDRLRKKKLAAFRTEGESIKASIDMDHVNGPTSFVQAFRDALVRAENFAKVVGNVPLP